MTTQTVTRALSSRALAAEYDPRADMRTEAERIAQWAADDAARLARMRSKAKRG